MKISLRPKYQLGGSAGKTTLSGQPYRAPFSTAPKANPYATWSAKSPSVSAINSYKAPKAFGDMFGRVPITKMKPPKTNNGLGAAAGIGAASGAIASIGGGLNIAKEYEPILEGIENAEKQDLKYKEWDARQRINNQPTTQPSYGGYPQKMQYGGWAGPVNNTGPQENPYEGTYDDQLTAASYDDIKRQRNTDIAVSTGQTIGAAAGDAAIAAAGGIPFIGAALDLSAGMRTAMGEETIINAEGDAVKVANNEPEAVMNSLLTDSGSKTIEYFSKGNDDGGKGIGEGFANLATGGLYGKIDGAISGVKETKARDARDANYGIKRSSGRTLGEVAYSNGSAIPTAQLGGAVESLKNGYRTVRKGYDKFQENYDAFLVNGVNSLGGNLKPDPQFAGNGKYDVEVEDKEVIEDREGNYETKNGKRHAQDPKNSGIKTTLDEGDFVWSRKYADQYKQLKKANAPQEAIEGLRSEQEAYAESQTQGNMTPKLQAGTPRRVGDEGYFPAYGPQRRQPGYSALMASHDEEEARIASMNRVVAAMNPKSPITTSSTKKKGKVRDKSGDVSYTPMPSARLSSTPAVAPVVTPVKGAMAGMKYKQRFGRTKLGKGLKDNKGEIIAGAGALAQLAATASQKSPDLDPINPGAPIKSDVAHYSRVRDYGEGKRDADLIAANKTIEKSGAGPGLQPAQAKAQMIKNRQDEATLGRIHGQNAQIEQAEESFNINNNRNDQLANLETRMNVQAASRADALRENSFTNDQTAAYGDIASGAAKDYLAYNADKELAKSIYGNTGIHDRSLRGKENKFYDAYKKANPTATQAEVNRAWLDELSTIT